MPDIWLEQQSRPCPRGAGECGGVAEPQEDSGVRYWACVECGYESGYEVVRPEQDSCSLGTPATQQVPKPVFVALGRKPS